MDLSADCGTLPTHSIVEGPVLEQELSRCRTESGGTILLQLLEFKTHLLEAVEELHIRRVAETRFEDQISKLVLKKQELEWEKESLQHQSETVANQHAESLISVKKQFQAKIRNIEEEKGKYQVSADLKEKEINNLKEELKSLQLLKYNLEKKSSELEQKLALQSRSKDSHLNQLGEVERRFSALSKQCAMVKQAHENLEENVDEAMKRNMKLTSAIEKQEAIIVSLKTELEEVSKQLIKAKMLAVRHNKSRSPADREQHIQQLHHKLNMETEMNKKLREENVALRAEKQEVVKSLQHTQQLLLSQTQTVSRVELELQTQGEQYQALKQEHEVMQEKSKATEDKVARLMESYTASKTSWDKEKAVFLDRIKREQQGLGAVSKAYDELHQGHAEAASRASVEVQRQARRDISPSLSASTQLFPALVEKIRGEEALNVPVCSSEPPGFGSLQHLVPTETEEPASLEDTGAVTELGASATTGGQDSPNHQQQSQFKQPLNPVSLFTCPFTNNLDSLCLSGTTDSDSSTSDKHINNSNASETDSNDVSGLIHATSSLSDNGLLISKGSCVRDTSAASSPDQRSVDGKSDEGDGEMSEKGEVILGKSNRKEERRNEEQPCDREIQGKEVKEGGGAGGKRGTLMAQAADRADREDSQRSAQDAGDTKQPGTETKDSAEGDGPDGVEERGTTGPRTPETQRPTQTTTDTTAEQSNTQQVIGLRHTEPPLAACEPSDCSQTIEKVADSSLVSTGYEIRREVHTPCHDEAQHSAQDSAHQISVKTAEEKPSDKSAPNIPTELSGPLNQYSVCNSQTNNAFQSDNIICIQETTATQTPPSNPSDMKQTDEMLDTHVRAEPQAFPHSQEIPEQQRGQLRSLIPDDEDDDSSVCKKVEGQSNGDTCENSETVRGAVEKSILKEVTVDTVESKSETSSYQENMKDDKAEDEGGAKTTKTDVHSSLGNDNGALPETSSTKCYAPSPAKETSLEDANELMSDKTYRPSFDWASSVDPRAKTDVSVLHHFVQGSVFEQNTRVPFGVLRQPSSTVPVFLKGKQNKVPSVVTRASDLSNASSFSGTAASSRRHQQGEWTDTGETATANRGSRASLSITSFPVSTSSITGSRQSWRTTPGCSRAPASAAGPSSEPDREPLCSQEREEQQSSFRAHISKIEQFLNTERLRLPKRRRMDK
ncbi:coiled-coil domain-containing protein 73 [Chaetodon trifascialis]|uniref:coiled-coil domain-containing protein 73 n=1 Tax=Chaetodon trifascialis TaxID=109706 RepID=UPI003992162C